MIIVSYDISDDKLRVKFAKYLSRFGHRIQYSVFEIDNSQRIVNNIVNDLKNKYESKFAQTDSVIIFKMSSSCEVMRFGYAKNDETDFLIIT
ncbi:CRISPR-associated endonuclease Cas2 [Jingyaoa shaoxingensis]|uniref:CRISPR-associated endoribonuclease Cas2 n=1 Tax=Jingyaoa shaoxingensis TaxID=2763671 RepID=A0ABR7NBZ8_9FIRM|nr:CRISPR-associated endonuclease Cas2 [Jingyaoa shaoxingensis]MBC8573926.1 CRISPR-associated endonuclease Cas2 [Jingyaoa shaoxingensis]